MAFPKYDIEPTGEPEPYTGPLVETVVDQPKEDVPKEAVTDQPKKEPESKTAKPSGKSA